jgi:hypothetical protein
MDLLRLTRLYKHSFPTDVLTNDPIIDHFLQKFDALLAGGVNVRSETLEEASDHILEHRDHLISAGRSPENASTEAVNAFNEYEDLAQIQRKGKYQQFVKMFFLFGIMFGGLMTAITLMSDQFWLSDEGAVSFIAELPKLAAMFVFQGVFYGCFMSYFFSFTLVQAKPKQSLNKQSSDVLNVYSQKSSKVSGVFLFVIMGLTFVVCLLGIGGYGLMAENGVLYNVVLLLIATPMMVGVRVIFNRYELNEDLLIIKTIAGLNHIKRDAILSLQALPRWHGFIAGSLGALYTLAYIDEAGKEQKLTIAISGDMHNADKLIASLQTIPSENKLK